MMPNTIFLHIGTEKTGTTSIQRFLELNEQKLLDDGIVFSSSSGRRQNWKLPLIAYSEQADDIGDRFATSQPDFSDKRQTLFSDIKKEIASASGKKLVFSSELLHSRLVSPASVKTFAKQAKQLGIRNPKIILYLREPAELANSLYSTSLRAGSAWESPPPPGTNRYFDNICNHRKTLESWSEAFGTASLTVRLFRRDQLVNSSVIDDFCNLLDIDSRLYLIPEEMNAGLSRLDAALLLRLNHLLPAKKNGRQNPMRGNMEAFFCSRHDIPSYRMPNSLWTRYKQYYSQSNEWVRRRFFPSETKLFPQPENCRSLDQVQGDYVLPDEASLDAMADLFYRIWINKQTQILNAKNG